jgi:hypothetical protein
MVGRWRDGDERRKFDGRLGVPAVRVGKERARPTMDKALKSTTSSLEYGKSEK